jgi:outer membrane protein
MSRRPLLPVRCWYDSLCLWQRTAGLVVLGSLALIGLMAVGGCVSDRVADGTTLTAYQRRLAQSGPQQRVDMEVPVEEEPLGLLIPAPVDDPLFPELTIAVDPNTGRRTVPLTIEQAIALTLANSPEIRVISFDPQIARQDVITAAGAFDSVFFGRANYEDQDSPPTSIFEPGRAETRLFESGIRQRTPLGTEWAASYALARIWDDLFGRALPTRYEPVVIFELRQPLLRDAWEQVNLAGVNIARLNYEASLLGFRERAEEVASAVAITYWRLVQAHRDLQIQQLLVEQTSETLDRVEGRRDIDATEVQIKQAQTYALSRQAVLLDLQKRVVDAQDALVRLIADPRINSTSDLSVLPESQPPVLEELPELAAVTDRALATAMAQSPLVQRARLGVEVAEINVQAAQNQQMPRLDLVGSARARGLARRSSDAHEQIEDAQYVSYAVGLVFEYPLGNRQRHAEWMRRRLEQRKATSILHGTADRVALAVKESVRRVRTSLAQVEVQRQAAEAARIHLATLEEVEQIRERLTPEFLLVKLQAQETYAQTQRAEIAARVELNVAMSELAQTTGTILDLRMIERSLESVIERLPEQERPREEVSPRDLLPPLPRSPSL